MCRKRHPPPLSYKSHTRASKEHLAICNCHRQALTTISGRNCLKSVRGLSWLIWSAVDWYGLLPPFHSLLSYLSSLQGLTTQLSPRPPIIHAQGYQAHWGRARKKTQTQSFVQRRRGGNLTRQLSTSASFCLHILNLTAAASFYEAQKFFKLSSHHAPPPFPLPRQGSWVGCQSCPMLLVSPPIRICSEDCAHCVCVSHVVVFKVDGAYPADKSHLRPTVFALHLAGGQIALPILVLICLLSKGKFRHFTLINFFISWIVYSVSFSLTYVSLPWFCLSGCALTRDWFVCLQDVYGPPTERAPRVVPCPVCHDPRRHLDVSLMRASNL